MADLWMPIFVPMALTITYCMMPSLIISELMSFLKTTRSGRCETILRKLKILVLPLSTVNFRDYRIINIIQKHLILDRSKYATSVMVKCPGHEF